MFPRTNVKSSLRASFQDVCCCFPAFWVVVVVVLLSHVSTQPQTQTHYYVKYNMQTQNLKPYNLKIQHMENVNRQYGVRSCFHLCLPAVDVQKKKKKKKLCLCAILTPKQFPKIHNLSQMRPLIDCFIQKAFKAQLQQCEKMNIIILLKWFCSFYGHENKTTDSHLVTTAYSLCKIGAKWEQILVLSPTGGLLLGKGNREGDGNAAFIKPCTWAGHGGHHQKSFGDPAK